MWFDINNYFALHLCVYRVVLTRTHSDHTVLLYFIIGDIIIKWTFGCFRVPFRWSWNSVIVPRSERNPRWKVLRTTGWCLSADRSTATFSILWRKSCFIYTKVSRDQKEVCEAIYYNCGLFWIEKLGWCVIQTECTLMLADLVSWSTVALQGQKVLDISAMHK